MRRMLTNRYTRTIAWILTIATATLSVPFEAFAFPNGIEKARAEHRAKIAKQHRIEQQAKTAKVPEVRPLTGKEMRMIVGRGPYRNAYFCGTMPWHRSFRDVNLCNGNLFKSFTDIQVAPARGAGLVLQRTYNSNDDREGPFGVGWTHAYDIRMEEASSPELADENIGVAQQSGDDPTSTMDKAVRVDFFGGKHVYKRDADGLYTPPPYSHDWTKSNYKDVLASGPEIVSDSQMGTDGTEKHFVSAGDERICDYIKDRYGNTTTLHYTTYEIKQGVTKQLLTKVTDPSDRELNFTWEAQTPSDLNGNYRYRVVSVTGPLQTVNYNYYTLGENGCGGGECPLKSVTIDPGGLNRTTTYTYTSCEGETGLLASIIDPIGNTVSYQYSLYMNGNLNFTNTVWVDSITEPGGVDSSGDPRLQQWEIESHVPNGFPTIFQCAFFIVYETGAEEDDEYGLGIYLGVDDELRAYEYGWDFWHDPLLVSTPNTCIISYDNANNVIEKFKILSKYPPGYASASNADVRFDNYRYSRLGNLKTHWLAGYEDRVETYTYYDEDKYFQKASFTDMDNNVTTFDYGSRYLEGADIGKRGNLLWCRDARHQPSGTVFTYEYNQYGQKIAETNLNGVRTEYKYGDGITTDPWNGMDTDGNLVKVVQDPGTGHLNRTTWMQYDEAGRVTLRQDPRGNTSQVVYNSAGQPTAAIFPDEIVSYSYGNNGRLESVMDNRGTTDLEYEDEQYSQPGVGDRLASVSDPITGTISYTYIRRGSIASKIFPNGRVWRYKYDKLQIGSPESQTYQIANTCSYASYSDDLNEFHEPISEIVDENGRLIYSDTDLYGVVKYNMSYDQYNNLISYCQTKRELYSVPGQLGSYTATWQKCTAGYLKKIINTYYWKDEQGVWQSKVLSANEYDYDDVGNRTENKVYGENNVLLRTETYGYDELSRLTSVNYGDGGSQAYTYDDMGNRLTMGGTTYGYNVANMLTTIDGQPYASYDNNGNQTSGGGRSNSWDSQNRLVSCTYNGTTSMFTYGADGLRRSMNVNSGTTTHYAYDGQNIAQEGHFDERDNYITDVSYLSGPRGTECRIDENTGVTKWYLYDGLDSVIGEVDEDGNVTYTAKYDVYGAVRGSTGSSDSKHKFVGGIGHTTEPDTGGLIYMRARWYDPSTGRFISEDPARNGINWYIYCDDNPINSTDPSGMFNIWKYLEGKALGAISGLLFIDVGRRMMGMGIRRYGDGQMMALEGRFLQYMAGADPSLLGALIDAPLEATGKIMQIQGGQTCKSAVKMVIEGAMLCMLGNMMEALGEDINYYTGTGVAH